VMSLPYIWLKAPDKFSPYKKMVTLSAPPGLD